MFVLFKIISIVKKIVFHSTSAKAFEWKCRKGREVGKNLEKVSGLTQIQ